MAHSTTTTFTRICGLYDEARQLLDKTGDGWLTPDEQQRFREIRQALADLWPRERAERVRIEHGPPRLISAPNPQDKRRVLAYGIAPLTRGDRL